jgi:hypothetical protein
VKLVAIIPVLHVVLAVVAIVDIVLIDGGRVRGLPKWAWVIVALLLTVAGPLLWFIVGRERLSRAAARTASASGPRAPDDDPEFLARLRREREQEQRIRDLEQQLDERRGDEKPDDTKPAE